MTFPGQSISAEEPSAEAAVLRSPDSGNPAAADIAGLINMHPLSSFQKGIMVLIGGVVLMDGFDIQAMGFVAPALTQDASSPIGSADGPCSLDRRPSSVYACWVRLPPSPCSN